MAVFLILFIISVQGHRLLQQVDDRCEVTDKNTCYDCINSGGTFCRYEKAFNFYRCCSFDDFRGICGSEDPDVQCSRSFEGNQKYVTCPNESIMCGNENIILVNATLNQTTTQYIKKDNLCHYKMQSYTTELEELNLEKFHIDFKVNSRAQTYFYYQMLGDDDWTIDQISFPIYYEFLVGDLKEKYMYVITISESDNSVMMFSHSKSSYVAPP